MHENRLKVLNGAKTEVLLSLYAHCLDHSAEDGKY